jgi:hypothetical protein
VRDTAIFCLTSFDIATSLKDELQNVNKHCLAMCCASLTISVIKICLTTKLTINNVYLHFASCLLLLFYSATILITAFFTYLIIQFDLRFFTAITTIDELQK